MKKEYQKNGQIWIDTKTDPTKDAVREKNPTGTNAAVLTYQNVDRLKHEVAFHNPDHLNPDEMLNHILNWYFKVTEEVRRKT